MPKIDVGNNNGLTINIPTVLHPAHQHFQFTPNDNPKYHSYYGEKNKKPCNKNNSELMFFFINFGHGTTHENANTVCSNLEVNRTITIVN